jgi:hypothetical protein
MCIGDWRLGRLIPLKITTRDLTAGGPLAIAADTNRVGIIFSTGFTTGTGTNLADIAINGSLMFSLALNTRILELNLAQHGRVPMQAFTVTVGATANATVCVIEQFMPEEFLAAGLDEFKRSLGIR